MGKDDKMLPMINVMLELVEEKCEALKEKQRAARIRADLASLVADSELSNEKKLDMLLWINDELWNETQSTGEA